MKLTEAGLQILEDLEEECGKLEGSGVDSTGKRLIA
jgi:hypothetical protein